MKTRYILLTLLLVSTVLIAGPFVPYDTTKPPSLSLPAAYEIATKTLGSDTNQFYCSQAKLETDFGRPIWSFRFSTTNTPPTFQLVWVYFDGTARLAPNVIL
jgi:hypothetical protein